MLTSNEIFNRIDEIVDQAYLNFTFRLVGADLLTDEQKIKLESLGLILGERPLIELIYLAVRQRATTGYQKDQTLQGLLSEIGRMGVLPVLTDEDQYTIDHAKTTLKEALEGAKTKLKKDLKSTILTANADHKQELTITPFTALPERRETTEENTSNLLTGLTMAAVGMGAIAVFRRDFTSSLTETVNTATIDEIQHQARMVGGSSDPWVYKQIVDDSRTSLECRALHTEDGSGANPRLYRLSELIANGSNVGKPRHAWKATVIGTHPGCRCILKEATKEQIERKE